MSERRQRDDREVGALWRKQGEKGPFLTGEIHDQPVLVFPVRNKKNPKMPDFRVLRGEPRRAPQQQQRSEPSDPFGFGEGDPFQD